MNTLCKIVGFLCLAAVSAGATTFYVSTSGVDDPAGGTFAAPFATIQYAADRMGSGDTCVIRGGSYEEEIAVSNTTHLTFAAYAGETVVLDGSTEITNAWTHHAGNIYKTTLAEDVWQLFAGESMLIPARWPNADPTVDFWEQWESDHWGEGRSPRNNAAPNNSNGVFYDKPHNGHDLAASGLNISNAIAVLNVGSFRTWTRVVDDHVAGTNRFTHAPVSASGYKDKEHYYFVEGKLELLDAENEWFFDPATKELYLWAPGGVDPSTLTIRGKTKTYCFTAKDCDDLTLSGIDFFAGTFKLDGGDRARIENGRFVYPSCTKRALRDIGAPQTSRLNGDDAVIFNCEFAYTDGHGIYVNGDDNTIENCYFHHIDYSVSELPSVMAALYMNGNRNIFRKNTLHSFGASVGYLQDKAATTEYNNFYNGGYKQHDGAMVQVMVANQLNAKIGWNWVHDWSRLGIRFDGGGGQGGLIHHSVGWGPNMNSTVYIGNHENNEVYNNSGIYSKSRNEIVIEHGGVPYKNNTNSITLNNIAPRMGGSNSGNNDVPGTFENNWNGQATGMDIRTQLRDPDNLDFRPIPGAAIIDAGVEIPGVTDGYLGEAPDIGAYEYGDPVYWIAGHQYPAASIPVPPVGTSDAKASASVMWLPALGAVSNDVYLGTSSNAVANATTASPEFAGNVVHNIFNPLGLVQQTYYWRVDSITSTGAVKGAVWSFAVAGVSAAPPNVVNADAKDIGETAAVIGGLIDDAGTAARVWTRWWPEGGATNTVEMGVQEHVFELPLADLSTNTTYYFESIASNTYGVALSPTASFTTLGAAWQGGTFTNWIELVREDFDAGFGLFAPSGGASLTNGSPPAASGSAVRFTNADAITLASALDLDTPGYDHIRIEFNLFFQGMDNADYHYLEGWNGAAWTNLATFNKGEYGNNTHHAIDLRVDETDVPFPADFKIRFRQQSGPNDNAYVDDVRISAREIVTFETPYDEWMYEYGLTGSATNLLADSDGDGLDQLTEYGLGGDPNTADAAAIAPSHALAESGDWVRYVYRRRTDANLRGLAYWIETNEDLTTNLWTAVESAEMGTAPLETGFESVTNRVDATNGVDFIRLRISVD